MFRQKYAVLVVLMAMIVTLPIFVYAANNADKDAILKEIGSFIDKNPDILRSVIYSIGDAYQMENKTDEAIAIYEKALNIFPDNEDFLSRLGELYNQKQDFTKVVEIFKKLAEKRPDNVWYFQRIADAYRNADDKENALKVWEDLMKTSDNPEVFMQAANYYSNENDMEKAIAAVKKAAGLMPDNMGYLQNLESFYMRAEKFDEAEAICNKVLASAEDRWMKEWANSELINIYQRQEKMDVLTIRFEKDLAAAPKELSHYRKLVDLYQRSDERDKAIEVYEKAVARGVADRDINNRLLDLYEWTEKFDKAEAQIKKIMLESPDDNYLYERLANLLGRSGKKDEARDVWGEFLAKVPNDAGLVSRFGDRLNEWGDTDGAIEQYRKAQAMDANNLWYTMRIVDLLIGQEKLKEAKKELNLVITKTSDDWMKQEAQRKITDIDARLSVKKEIVPVSVPEPEVKPELKVKEEAKEAKEEPKKKKRGWFGR